MQFNFRRRAPFLFGFIAFYLILSSQLANASPIATVQSATGAFLRRESVVAFSTLSGRTPLNAGDAVRTGPRGKANLLFFDGSQVRLNSNTTVEITSPTKARGGRQSFFRALAGEVYARMRPGSAAQSRTAVAGVRGTEILLQVAEDGTTTLTVIEGVVDFYNELGAVVVNASQQSTAAPGHAPSTPITIQNPGLLIEWTFDLDFIVLPREKFWVSRDDAVLKAELERRRNSPQLLGDVLFDMHRYEAALESYSRAEEAAPNDGALQMRTGYTLLELGRLDEAEAAFRRALGEQVAARLVPKIQLIAATDETSDVDEQSTLRVQSLLGLAWVALTRNHPEDAQKRAEQAVTIAPNSVEALTVLGIAQLRQGNNEAAIQNLQKAREGIPASLRYQAQAWLALALLAQDDQAGALREAQAAAKSAPDSALASGHLALALLFSGDAREATREARRAAELNPDSVAARVALAQALLARGSSDAAAQEAAVAAALDPSLPQAQYMLGLADAARRDYSHAARELQVSVRIAPEFLPAVAALARVYTLMGREGEAVALLTDFQNRHANSPDVLAALGQVYYQQGNYREAAEQYQKAVKIQPGSALYQAELARLLLDDNQLSEAIKAAQRAVYLAPQVGQYHALLGLIADFSGLGAYAEREYRSAIALDPQNALARARIGLLNAADPRTGFNTTTQAFLYDPAISRQLFRGGVQAEATVAAGSDNAWGILGAHRWQSENGEVYDYGIESAGRSDGDDHAPHDETRQTGVQELLTWVPNNRTNVLLRGSMTDNEGGFNGPPGTRDDRSETTVPRAAVAARYRVGSNHYLWAGARYDWINTHNTDPNFDSNFFMAIPPVLYFFDDEKLRARVFEPEVRLDLNLSDEPGRSTLTLGASYAKQRTLFRQSITANAPFPPFPFPLGEQVFDGTRRKRLFYAQWAHRLNDRTSFVAQLRHQNAGGTSNIDFLGTPLGSTVTDETRILPSILINHQLDKKTSIRFFANRNKFDLGLQAFAPTETLLAGEASVFANGFSDDTRLYELDVERYFSPRTFGKVFVFRSRSELLNIGSGGGIFGSIPVGETRRTGAGVRLEHRISDDLFASLLLGYNRTMAQTAGTVFQGDTAPYQPRHFAQLALNYIAPNGNKAGISINNTGSFYRDNVFTGSNRPRFPARTTVDLRLAREPSLKHEVFLNIYNIFNTKQIQFNNFPAAGRRFEIGYTRRF